MRQSIGTPRTRQFSGLEVLWFVSLSGLIHYAAGYLHGWVNGALWWF